MQLNHNVTPDPQTELLIERLEEELTDVCTYNSLYEAFVSRGMPDEAYTIERIARDEYKHASLIQILLDNKGVAIPKESPIPDLWQKARAVFHV